MSRVLVTGSADGLGLLAARRLLDGGHEVVLHARSERRAKDVRAAEPRAADVLAGDLGSIAQTTELAEAANASGGFDGVIHNAGIYLVSRRTETEDGLPNVFQVNVLAPYLLTALMTPAKRLVYLSSGLHRGGGPDLEDLSWERRRWSAGGAYAEAKLLDVALAFAVARLRPDTFSNAVTPGWVPTKMGGPAATDDLEEGAATQVWLAAGEDPAADVSGRYFFHRQAEDVDAPATDPKVQDGLLDACRRLTGVTLR